MKIGNSRNIQELISMWSSLFSVLHRLVSIYNYFKEHEHVDSMKPYMLVTNWAVLFKYPLWKCARNTFCFS